MNLVNISYSVDNLASSLTADPHAVSTTTTPMVYASCTWHLDCDSNQFCGVKCWTGGCGEGVGHLKGKKPKKHNKFCQPCAMCKKHTDSVTRSCDVCEVPGKIDA